jgi:hypothetical protein
MNTTIKKTLQSIEKLTFKSGTGDADDWYVVYADKKTFTWKQPISLRSKPVRKQRKNPHAIQYLEYKDVDGIPIATKWIFWAWKMEKDWWWTCNRYQIC